MANKTKHTPEEHAQWEALAREGVGTRQIALRLGVSYGKVSTHLKRVGLFKRNYSTNTKLTEDQRREIVAEYSKGAGATTLARKYAVDKKLIYIVLNTVGAGSRPRNNRTHGVISLRNKTHLRKRTGKPWGNTGIANHEAFDGLSDAALYWMGFIAADGCIGTTESFGGSQPTIHIGLSSSDISHVKAFKKFVGVEQKKIRITVGDGFAGATGMCSFSVSSRKLVDACKAQGITERKGAGMTVSPTLANSPAFWRGVWDGDGSIASVIPYLSGSAPFLNQWRTFAEKNGLPFDEPELNNAETTYVSHISNNNAENVKKLCQVLGWEKLGSPALLRKRVCACSLMQMRPVPRSRAVTTIDIPGPLFSIKVDGLEVSGVLFGTLVLVVADPEKHNALKVPADFWPNVKKVLSDSGLQLLLAMPGDSEAGWKNLLSSRLGSFSGGKGARSYDMIRADGKLANAFYPVHHIQGSVGGRHYALVNEALDPVAFLTMAKPSACRASGEDCGMLARFAVKGHVPGAASRLLAAALGDRPQDIITFSDHRYTNGGVYAKIGFEEVAHIPPSYLYVKNGRVFNKAELQKKSLFLEAGVMTDETEAAIAARLGYLRMYDAGKTKWILHQKKQPPA